jgi:hypothetical protein
MSSVQLYAAGVALSVCISAANSLGMGLQKRAHRRLQALPEAAVLLRRLALTGELPDLFVGDLAGAEAVAARRDNEERDLLACWDAPPARSPPSPRPPAPPPAGPPRTAPRSMPRSRC